MLSPGPGAMLGPRPHSRSPVRNYGPGGMGRDEGQILPGLLVVLLALLAVGMLMFQVGKAAVLRSEAQTAADAAALAGATEIRRQLTVQWATSGTTDLTLIDRALVIATMREYASKNGAALVPGTTHIDGVDVKTTVSTDETLGEGARDIDSEDKKGFAKARARIEVAAGLGGASIGPVPGGGGGGGTGPVPRISGDEWKALGKRIHTGAPV